MNGYDLDAIDKLDKIMPSVYEPVQPTTEVTQILGIISYVVEGKSFMEISKKFLIPKNKLSDLFMNVPSLPRPNDYDKYSKENINNDILNDNQDEQDSDDILNDLNEI